MTIDIVPITECPGAGPILARWHVHEWAHLYGHWTVDDAIAEFAAMNNPDALPMTWLALDGDGALDRRLLGSISLIEDDELEGYRDTSPWLASLYVVPRARGGLLGRQLVDRCVAEAKRLGVDRLHLFTDTAAAWYRRAGWRTIGSAEANGHAVDVMVLDVHPCAPRHATASRWIGDPLTRGAYSSLRPGGGRRHRLRLAEPVHHGLILAGEHTSAEYPGTMHGAWFSGERAAGQAIDATSPGDRIAIVGAGLAGIAAARAVADADRVAVVLEGAATSGGRTRTDRSLGVPVHLGAAWVHGDTGNPIAAFARELEYELRPGTWRRTATFVAGHGELSAADRARAEVHRAEVERRLHDVALERECAVGDVLPALVNTIADPIARLTARSWLLLEFENLYAAPVSDLSLRERAEPYAMDGEDLLITGPLDGIVATAAGELDIRYEHVVRSVTRTVAGWCASVDEREDVNAAAVIVTVPIGVLQDQSVGFDPPVPPGVAEALSFLNRGFVNKAFLTFDVAWWAPRTALFIAADPRPTFELFVDVSVLTGVPTLAAFATGAHARAVETMSEDTLCAEAFTVLRSAGAVPSE
jgi:monoamine oxidase/GNAT superfamily N-acetyltransferase